MIKIIIIGTSLNLTSASNDISAKFLEGENWRFFVSVNMQTTVYRSWMSTSWCVLIRSKPMFYRRLPSVRFQRCNASGIGDAGWSRDWRCCLPWHRCSSGSRACTWRVSGNMAVGHHRDQVTTHILIMLLFNPQAFAVCVAWILLPRGPWQVNR